MKQFLIVLLLLSLGLSLYSQETQKSAADLKKEMAAIRRTTNWGNEEEAKKADAKIQELSKQLIMVNKVQNQQKSGNAADTAKIREEVEYQMKIWGQIMKSVDQGVGGDILLGTPMREEIVEAYKDDESPKIKNKEYLEEQTFLCIDMSLPTVQRTIDQMALFKSIKFLLITGGKNGAPVNLNDLLTRAANYPLEKLYIINFRIFVTAIPDKVAVFNNLSVLALFNNNIGQLPVEVGQLTSLKELYVDMNHVTTIFPMIQSLSKLDTLGIAKTNIPENEVHQIETLLPNCKILTQ